MSINELITPPPLDDDAVQKKSSLKHHRIFFLWVTDCLMIGMQIAEISQRATKPWAALSGNVLAYRLRYFFQILNVSKNVINSHKNIHHNHYFYCLNETLRFSFFTFFILGKENANAMTKK